MKTSIIKEICKKAKMSKMRIVLPESHHARTIAAAKRAVDENIASIILLGREEDVGKSLGDYSDSIKIVNPLTFNKREQYIKEYLELRKERGMNEQEAIEIMKTPLYFGAMMVRMGDAEGMVAGAVSASSEVLRAAIQIVKCRPDVPIVSSCVIMELSRIPFIQAEVWAMADCVVNINPTAEQLAVIAISTADTFKKLLNMEPKVAMLSFSTKGSAKHEFVDKVVEATRLVREKRPDILIDGELQLDAAIIPEVGKTKSPDSRIAGQANVLIFPDIQSGNIGSKLVERVGGGKFMAVLQGLNRPVNDLSRGCNADDILNTIAITVVQAQKH